MSKNELIIDITTMLRCLDHDTLIAIDRTIKKLSDERKPNLIQKMVSFFL